MFDLGQHEQKTDTVDNRSACNTCPREDADQHTGMIIGIDPGLNGAIAFYSGAQELVVGDVPRRERDIDLTALVDTLKTKSATIAVIERGGAPGGKSFSAGFGYGVLLTTLRMLQIPTHIVAPITWKSHFGLSSDKQASCQLAGKLWPSAPYFSRVRDHNRAEAALIALFGAEVILHSNWSGIPLSTPRSSSVTSASASWNA